MAAPLGDGYSVSVIDCASQIGSGSLPLETLPSAGLAITPVGRKGAGTRIEALASAFRSLPIPVIGRIKDGALILDLRCLEDEASFVDQLGRLKVAPDGRETRDARR
jgi:L-seryl-tRNA(Ser) seleniumtransferase